MNTLSCIDQVLYGDLLCSSDGSFSSSSRSNEFSQPKSSKIKKRKHRSWDDMFNRLLKFKEKNGHCYVPSNYPEDKKLATWVAIQRSKYEALMCRDSVVKPITVDKVIRLQQIGFDWSPKDPISESWEARFLELVQFVALHGHARVPQDSPLSQWTFFQRQDYRLMKAGLLSQLTPQRIQLLNFVGFNFDETEQNSQETKKREKLIAPEILDDLTRGVMMGLKHVLEKRNKDRANSPANTCEVENNPQVQNNNETSVANAQDNSILLYPQIQQPKITNDQLRMNDMQPISFVPASSLPAGIVLNQSTYSNNTTGVTSSINAPQLVGLDSLMPLRNGTVQTTATDILGTQNVQNLFNGQNTNLPAATSCSPQVYAESELLRNLLQTDINSGKMIQYVETSDFSNSKRRRFL